MEMMFKEIEKVIDDDEPREREREVEDPRGG